MTNKDFIEENEKKEVELDETSKQKSDVYLTEDVQKDLQDLMPKVSFDEIMSSETDETRSADKIVLLFGKYLSQYKDQVLMNQAMRILYVASELNVKEGSISRYNIHQAYCIKYGDVSWEEFDKMMKPLIGKSSLSPFQKNGDDLKFTSLGRILLHNYQKLKAEMVGMKKYGPLQDLFCMIDDIRSFWNYGQYGMDIEIVFSLTNNLKNLIEDLKAQGDEILKDPRVDAKITKIHELIDQVMEIHQAECNSPSETTIQQKVRITRYLVEALMELASISGRKFKTRLISSRDALIDSPFPELEVKIIRNWDLSDWSEWFYNCSSCSQPVKLQMKINEVFMKKTLLSFLKQRPEIEYGELPPAPSEDISTKTVEELLAKEQEMQTLKEMLYELAVSADSKVDYEIAKDKEPFHFLDNLLMFYELAREELVHVNVEEGIKEIHDDDYKIKSFTARSFTINSKQPTSDMEIAREEIGE